MERKNMMPNLKPPIGFSNFPELMRKGYYYVDKSLFIRAVLDSPAKVLLLPRPRRFGKTLNLSLLRSFLERGRPDHARIFQGLAIARAGGTYLAQQGRYPVVFLTLKDTKSQDWASCLEKLKHEIAGEFQRHAALLETDILSRWEKERYESILSRKGTQADYENSLKNLLTWLARAYGEQVVLLMDEYDTPIHAGYQYGYYDQVVSFLRNWLSGALKDHDALEKGVLTGILRVARGSIFSGLNNLRVEGILAPGPFADKFGFTEGEVERLLADFGLSDTLPEVRAWYNGYRFGETVIYNPWSILNFIADQPAPAAAHWINTSSNELVLQLIRQGDASIRQGVETLLQGGTVTSEIEAVMSLRDIRLGATAVWSLLLLSGYLKSVGRHREGDDRDFHALALPNREVRVFFVKTVNAILAEYLEASALHAMLQALVAGDVAGFEKHLQTLVLGLLSFHDTAVGKGNAPEAVYQSFVLGLVANLGHEYRIRSNIESGLGRADILMFPKRGDRRGIVMEFKRLKKGQKIEHQLEAALAQIEEKGYGAEMRAEGVRDILALAVVFTGKRLMVGTCNGES